MAGHLPYLFLYAFYTLLFARMILRWQFFTETGIKKAHLLIFFALKVAAGLGLTLIYTYYYTDQSKADIYRYFNDSKIISCILFTDPLAWIKIMTGFGTVDPEAFKYLHDTWHFTHPAGDIITSNSFLIRLISLLNYLSGYNIYIDTLLFNWITFLALALIFKTLKPYFKMFPQILYWPLFLLPSFIFWSSGLLKEGLIFTGISLYLWGLLNINSKPVFKVATLATGLLIVALTKIYIALFLILCGAPLLLKYFHQNIRTIAMAAYLVLISLGGFYFKEALCETVSNKRNEFLALANTEHSGSVLDISPVTDNCNAPLNMLANASTNAVLRPFFWEKENLFQLLFAVENFAFLVALLFLLVGCFKRPKGDGLLLIIFSLSFAILNYLTIGLTIPILGAIVHYRIIAMPFLLLSVLLMTDLEKLKHKIRTLLSLQ